MAKQVNKEYIYFYNSFDSSKILTVFRDKINKLYGELYFIEKYNKFISEAEFNEFNYNQFIEHNIELETTVYETFVGDDEIKITICPRVLTRYETLKYVGVKDLTMEMCIKKYVNGKDDFLNYELTLMIENGKPIHDFDCISDTKEAIAKQLGIPKFIKD